MLNVFLVSLLGILFGHWRENVKGHLMQILAEFNGIHDPKINLHQDLWDLILKYVFWWLYDVNWDLWRLINDLIEGVLIVKGEID